jgi:NAD(P)H-flavin reductase
MAETTVGTDIELAPGAGPLTPTVYRVTDRRVELADTISITLEPVDAALPQCAPGQFNMLWAFGVGEVPISVSERAGIGSNALHHTIRAVGATTRALCGLELGEALGVRGPFGRGWDIEVARSHDVIVMAGGLGLAPVRPLVEAILEERDAFGRVVVLVGSRSPDDLLYAEWLSSWRSRFDVDVEVTVDHAGPEWHGDVGVVTSLVSRVPVDDRARAFVCGPEIMMRFAGKALVDAGLAAEHIQVSLERNMVCAVAHCGHCQLGPTFVCREGPVYSLDAIGPFMAVRAL